jgi:hypothetical protein
MEIKVRVMDAGDRAAWAEMRAALWPDETALAHAEEIDELLAGGEAWGFVAEHSDGGAAGFAEVAIRKYANGCDSRPVAFLEGIWVRPQLRRADFANSDRTPRCTMPHRRPPTGHGDSPKPSGSCTLESESRQSTADREDCLVRAACSAGIAARGGETNADRIQISVRRLDGCGS